MTKAELIQNLGKYSDDTIVLVESSFPALEDDSKLHNVLEIDETLDGDIVITPEPF